MRSSELEYELPRELIAQHPAERRDGSRLLVFRRDAGEARHRVFADLPEEIGDALVVVNDTKVLPVRLELERWTGGSVEILLLERTGDALWEALARPSRRLRAGERLSAGAGSPHGVELVASLGRAAGASASTASRQARHRCRHISASRRPTPAATRPCTRVSQGSAAAPTAGLHFTSELLGRLAVERVTLHVGLDTFGR